MSGTPPASLPPSSKFVINSFSCAVTFGRHGELEAYWSLRTDSVVAFQLYEWLNNFTFEVEYIWRYIDSLWINPTLIRTEIERQRQVQNTGIFVLDILVWYRKCESSKVLGDMDSKLMAILDRIDVVISNRLQLTEIISIAWCRKLLAWACIIQAVLGLSAAVGLCQRGACTLTSTSPAKSTALLTQRLVSLVSCCIVQQSTKTDQIY
jgi:hypothetical protein